MFFILYKYLLSPLICIITDYERLRIGGLIFAGLLFMGGLSIILCKLKCYNKYANIDSW